MFLGKLCEVHLHDQSTIAFGAFAHRTIGQGLHACDLKLHSERTIEGQRSGSEIHMPFTMGQSPMSYDVAAMFSRRSSNNVAKLWTIVDGSVATCFDMYSTNLRRSYLVLESSDSQGGRSPAQQTRQTNVGKQHRQLETSPSTAAAWPSRRNVSPTTYLLPPRTTTITTTTITITILRATHLLVLHSATIY